MCMFIGCPDPFEVLLGVEQSKDVWWVSSFEEHG